MKIDNATKDILPFPSVFFVMFSLLLLLFLSAIFANFLRPWPVGILICPLFFLPLLLFRFRFYSMLPSTQDDLPRAKILWFYCIPFFNLFWMWKEPFILLRRINGVMDSLHIPQKKISEAFIIWERSLLSGCILWIFLEAVYLFPPALAFLIPFVIGGWLVAYCIRNGVFQHKINEIYDSLTYKEKENIPAQLSSGEKLLVWILMFFIPGGLFVILAWYAVLARKNSSKASHLGKIGWIAFITKLILFGLIMLLSWLPGVIKRTSPQEEEAKFNELVEIFKKDIPPEVTVVGDVSARTITITSHVELPSDFVFDYDASRKMIIDGFKQERGLIETIQALQITYVFRYETSSGKHFDVLIAPYAWTASPPQTNVVGADSFAFNHGKTKISHDFYEGSACEVKDPAVLGKLFSEPETWIADDTTKKIGDQISSIALSDVRYVHYEEHGAPGVYREDFYLDVGTSTVYYVLSLRGETQERATNAKIVSQKLSKQGCQHIADTFRRERFHLWRSESIASGVCDGTFWNLYVFLKNGDHLHFYGSNQWPKSNFWEIYKGLFQGAKKSMHR